ncbi:NADP-dependent oxidoreductase [Frankia sp. CiP3]|uniref:NADP-dependent oxidoreductase n=1 Tax=Frankia sp. CiP3 TaxID=2880971 RepID=UPI001EF740E9|nr:NADP-dependent oxidoreductase [Frankia sp. CiP3]
MTGSREWHLVRRPTGWPTDDDVALVEVDVPGPGPGELLVRNTAMSVEPYMRGRMSEAVSYTEPYALGAPMLGHAVGTVIASGEPAIPVGRSVVHQAGWREYALVPAAAAEPVDTDAFPAATYLGALGITGMTAYVGLSHVAACKPGETVFVSAAAGAVGATAGQIAKAMGCRVIGSAGAEAKVRFLTEELGYDAAFNYRDVPVRASLAVALTEVGADGLDVYFDNVGGEQLEAAIRVMRPFGRIALCGAISTYNATEPVPGPRNLLLMIWRRLRMTGFLVSDHADQHAAFTGDMSRWLRAGAVRSVETAVHGGVEAAWPAFLAMLRGDNVGKMIVHFGSSAVGDVDH